MALLTGTQLATALDLTYAADPFDQVAAAAVAVVSSVITAAALAAEPAALKEATLGIGIDIFQARFAAGGRVCRPRHAGEPVPAELNPVEEPGRPHRALHSRREHGRMTALTTEARLAITTSMTGLGYKVYTSTPPSRSRRASSSWPTVLGSSPSD
jgi:hypothetical protein